MYSIMSSAETAYFFSNLDFISSLIPMAKTSQIMLNKVARVERVHSFFSISNYYLLPMRLS